MPVTSVTVSAQALQHWRSSALALARSHGIELAGVDWLLRELAGVDRLRFHLADPRDPEGIKLSCSLDTLNTLWEDHCIRHIPLQYIVGFTPWRTLRLAVAPGVLIPRSETELLVDIALDILHQEPQLAQGDWVDLGTGSGAIPIALALEAPELALHGVDISPQALRIAQRNGEAYGFATPGADPCSSSPIQWHCGSWFEPFEPGEQFAAMLSNPPYIPTAIVAELSPQVRDYEPHVALDGGATGLVILDHLIQTAPTYLQPGGLWLVEVMAGQATIVAEQLEKHPHYERIQIHRDLAQIDRFVSARKNCRKIDFPRKAQKFNDRWRVTNPPIPPSVDSPKN